MSAIFKNPANVLTAGDIQFNTLTGEILLKRNGVVQILVPASGPTAVEIAGDVNIPAGNTYNINGVPISGGVSSVVTDGVTITGNGVSGNAISIALNAIINNLVSSSAAIDGAKVIPNFVAQDVITTGNVSASAVSASTLTLATNAANGYVLTSDANGVASWQASSGSITFVDNEIPSGTVDGNNTAFTLSNTPLPNSLYMYVNGQLQYNPGDYGLVGNAVTFTYGPTGLVSASYRI